MSEYISFDQKSDIKFTKIETTQQIMTLHKCKKHKSTEAITAKSIPNIL